LPGQVLDVTGHNADPTLAHWVVDRGQVSRLIAELARWAEDNIEQVRGAQAKYDDAR
jgi:hypothetical protein